jgi:hypothetical protein
MSQVTGGGETPFNQIFQDLNQLPVTSADAKEGLASLQQLTDQVVDKGYVSQTDIQNLKNQANIVAPNLSAPQQTLLNQYANEISTIHPMTGGKASLPIGSGKNAFLNCSAVLMLFIMTSKIIGLESKIQLAENLYKAKLSLVMLATAESAYAATVAKGVLESEQYKAQALKASIDAGCALGQVVSAITFAVVSKIQENKETAKVLEDPSRKGKDLTSEERSNILRIVEQKVAPLRNSTEGIIQMIKSTAEAKLAETQADIAINSAIQQATADFLNKVVDLLSQSASMLGKSADTDMAQSIQSQMELLATAIRTYGEIGSR